jgi:nucleotide-binding universal stress UspA family protein
MSELITRLDVPAGVHVQPVARQGDPGAQLLEYAADTQSGMIAVGTRGQGFVARMLVGSVATKIIRASPIAVLTLPE